MSWVDQTWPVPTFRQHDTGDRRVRSHAYVTCRSCKAALEESKFLERHRVCHICGYHHVLTARQRLRLLCGAEDAELLGEELEARDVLEFCDTMPYAERINAAKRKTDMSESVLSAVTKISGSEVALSVFDFNFIGGSLGEVAGSRVVLAIQAAIKREIPFICVTASGGARMQEGMVSLLQMAKMSAAVSQLRAKKLPFMTILTHPTFGGVSASIAMQADLIIAESGAHIGFTGARVIANAMPQALPEGFQTAEFLCEHGAVDAVVSRDELAAYVGRFLRKVQVNRC